MIASRGRAVGRLATLLLPAVLLGGLAACDKVPLLAPTDSTVTVFVNAATVPLNGSAEVTASVVEPAGTPVHDGTVVTFTTSLGRIEPAEARTHGGKATARFVAGSTSGTARISAFSGGASATEVELLVGGAAATRLSLRASPASLPSTGGTSEVTAVITDDSGNRVPSVPVTFSTSAGSLDQSTASTDVNGEARTRLTTTRNAEVRANAGSAEATVNIELNAAIGITVTPPASLQASTPATFTINVTAPSGSVIRDATVNWGDGTSTSLGALSGSATVTHTYNSAGDYAVSVTAEDSNGERTTQSTSVTVVPIQVEVTLNGPTTARVGESVTFTASVSPSTIQVASWTFIMGDGTVYTKLSTATTVSQTHAYLAIGRYTVTVEIRTTTGETYTAQATINVTT